MSPQRLRSPHSLPAAEQWRRPVRRLRSVPATRRRCCGSALSPRRTSRSREIPVRVRGALVVEFHGDRATGCAARGLCGFSGTVIWQPPPTGTLAADAFRDHGAIEYDVSLELSSEGLSFGPLVQGGITTADVRSAPNGSAGASSTCTDAAATGAAIEMPVHLRAASLTLATATPSLLGTRCAGPLQSDIASVLARRVVDIATLSHGRVGVSLASSADFAVHGLAGTVTSTVQLSLGRPTTQRVPDVGSSPGRSKARTVVISYRAHLEGSVVSRAHGDPSSCAPLGSCGANGAFALSVHSTPGTLVLGAITRARRPVRDVLTALGLRKDGNPRGIQVFGIFFVRGPATYAVDVIQGASTCRDTAPAGLGTVYLSVTRGRLVAALVSDQQASHLRCPGPVISRGQRTCVRVGAHRPARPPRRHDPPPNRRRAQRRRLYGTLGAEPGTDDGAAEDSHRQRRSAASSLGIECRESGMQARKTRHKERALWRRSESSP